MELLTSQQRAAFVLRQGNAPALIEIARKESDPNLKREAVEAVVAHEVKRGERIPD